PQRVAGRRHLVTHARSILHQVIVFASLAALSPLVTHWERERPGVARSPGGLGATAGRARHGWGRGSNRGCLASVTSGVGWRPCSPAGTRVWSSGVGAWRSAGPE